MLPFVVAIRSGIGIRCCRRFTSFVNTRKILSQNAASGWFPPTSRLTGDPQQFEIQLIRKESEKPRETRAFVFHLIVGRYVLESIDRVRQRVENGR